MPIRLNLPNFLNAPTQQPDYSGLENLPGKMLQAYMMPMQMQRQQEEHNLKQLLGKAQANYYNKKATEVNKTAQSDLEKLMNSAKAIELKYGKGSEEDKYAQAYLQSKLKGEGSQGLSTHGKEYNEFNEAIKNVVLGSPEYKRLHQQYGLPIPRTEKEIEALNKDVPGGVENAVDLTDPNLPANSRLDYTKTQNDTLSKYNAMNEGLHAIEEAKKLNEENPELWSSMTKHMQDAIDKDPGTFKAYIFSQFQNEKDKTQLDKFAKTFWKLVNVDAKVSRIKGDKAMQLTTLLTMRSKGGPGTTQEGNRYVLDQLEHDWSPGKYGSKAIRTAQRLNYFIPENSEIFREKYNEEKANKEAQQKEALNRPGKRLKNVTWQAIDETARKHKTTREQVLKTLKLSPSDIRE